MVENSLILVSGKSSDCRKEFVVDKHSGSIDGYDSYGLGLDHFDLNKFSGPEDSHFLLVVNEMRKMLEKCSTYKSSLNVHLRLAAQSSHTSSTMHDLVRSGAEVQSQNDAGTTALHYASSCGHFANVKVLIDSDANLNITRDGGITPLHDAARTGYADVTSVLIAVRASLGAQPS